MNWPDLAKTVGGIAPILGTLLAGPAGGAVGAIVASALGVNNDPTSVSQAIQADPNAAAKIIEIEATQKVRLQELLVSAGKNRLDAESANVAAVNTTIQAEVKAEHWMSYSWRPYCGFAFGTMGLIGGATAAISYIGVMFFGVKPEVLSYLPAMLGAEAAVMATIAPVLGIASWFRGKAQADPNNAAEVKG